uniref:Ubiquitin-like domain-containing protein n=1 Tax=Angiostrongylus cantonensis TaxID=6313 RepID=A0A0K0D284_ANGCA
MQSRSMLEVGPGQSAREIQVHFLREESSTFNYSTPDVLYRQFSREANRMGGPDARAYWTNRGENEIEINDAEMLFSVVQGRSTVKIRVEPCRSSRVPHFSADDRVGFAGPRHSNGEPSTMEGWRCLYCGHVRQTDGRNPPPTCYDGLVPPDFELNGLRSLPVGPLMEQNLSGYGVRRGRVLWRFVPVPYFEGVNVSHPPNGDH